MKLLRRLSLSVAAVLAAGEVARYWRRAEFVPMALDELGVSAALVWAAWRAPLHGAAALAAAWGAFCGLMLVLLVETAGHLIHGPSKAHAWIYLAALTALLLLGLWAVGRALRLARRPASAAGRAR